MAGEGPTLVLAPVRPRRPHAPARAAAPTRRRVRRHRRARRSGDPRAGDDAILRPLDRGRTGATRPRVGPVVVAAPGQLVARQVDLHAVRFVDGTPVGAAGPRGRRTSVPCARSRPGSWLGRAHQGQGLGREMREAILHLAFAGLEAEEALSGAFEDNAASFATSRAVGYEENGEARGRRRDGSSRTIRFRIGPGRLGAASPGRHRDHRARGLPRHVRGSARLTHRGGAQT